MKPLLSLLAATIVAVISSYLTYFFAMKSKKSEVVLKFKEEKYSNLLVLLQGFVGVTADGETKRRFFEEQYRSWLYCSDGIVKAINDMVQLIIQQKSGRIESDEGKKAVGRIVLEMRKDLLGNTRLSSTDFSYTDVLDSEALKNGVIRKYEPPEKNIK